MSQQVVAGDPRVATQLAGFTLFAGLDRAADLAARLGEPGACPAGHRLISEGGHGRACHLVLDGAARVESGVVDLGVVGPGDLVGELAVLDDSPRSASVTALTPLRFLTYDSERFQQLLDGAPAVRHRLTQTIARRLRATASGWTALAGDADLLLDALLALQRSPDPTMRDRARRQAAALLAEAGPGRPVAAVVDDLTPAQRRVAELVADGLSNRDIAARLHLSPHTIDSHLRRAYDVVGVRSRVSLAGLVLRGR